jgi:hypothetical protein
MIFVRHDGDWRDAESPCTRRLIRLGGMEKWYMELVTMVFNGVSICSLLFGAGANLVGHLHDGRYSHD